MDHSLSNSSMSHECRATQDRQFMVESSDKTWSTEEGNGKPLQYSCLENTMNSMKRQKNETVKPQKANYLITWTTALSNSSHEPLV